MNRNHRSTENVRTNMRRFLVPVFTMAMIAAACGSGDATIVAPSDGAERAAPSAAAPVTELAAGFNDAGFEVLRDQPSDSNTILSPLSIGHALLMVRAAADEPTGTAIDDGFALPDGIGAHDAWNVIDQSIEQSNGTSTSMADEPTPIVAIADRIWPRAGLDLGQEWVDLMASHHGADIETIDVDAPEESRARINDWVSEQTNQLIPELLPKDFIDGNTLLVLTDAVYFKAQWKLIFLKYGTVDAPFTNLDGSQSTTTFMRELEQPAPRGFGDRWAAAELPYLGDDYSMLVIVPDDFETFRNELSQSTLDEIDGCDHSGALRTVAAQVGSRVRHRPPALADRDGRRSRRLSGDRRRFHRRRRARRGDLGRRDRDRGRCGHRSWCGRIRTAGTGVHDRRRPAVLVCDPPHRERHGVVRRPGHPALTHQRVARAAR